MESIHIFGNDSEWLWIMVQSLAVIVTGVLVLRQLRLQRNAHLVSSFSILHDRWNSQMMLRARHLVCTGYKPESRDINFQSCLVGTFFDELGGYCRLGHLDINMAWENYSFYVEHYWVILENQINCYRERNGNDRSYYHHFERLYDEFRKISESRNVPAGRRSHDAIKNFITFENDAFKFLENSGSNGTN
jgi:cytochrome c biogenesis factor